MKHPHSHLKCTVDDCELRCVPASRFCGAHRWKFLRNGHGEGRAVRQRELRPFREIAERILATHAARPDVSAAVTWCNKLLVTSLDKHTNTELNRLRRGGVTGADVLLVTLTLWGYAQRFPGSLPDDARLTYALGRGVVRLRRQPSTFVKGSLTRRYSKYVPGSVYRELGMLLRSALSLLCVRLLKLHERERDENTELLLAIRGGAPTDPPDILQPMRPQR